MDKCIHSLQAIMRAYTRLNILQRRRLIISTILALNLCVLFWRMTWHDINFTTSLQMEKFNHNGTELIQWQDEQLQQQQQQRKIKLYERLEGYINKSILPVDYPNMNYDIFIRNEREAQTFGTTNSKSRYAVSTLRLNANDAQQWLIDHPDFNYKLQVSACSRRILALIVVHTAPENFAKRQQIRETWANKELLRSTPLRVVFLLGSVSDKKLQQKILIEYLKYTDMVQGSFRDYYRNLTYKHVMAFKWFLAKCAHAQLLIKVDDDILVNTPLLLKYARHMKASIDSKPAKKQILDLFNHPQRLIFCQLAIKSKVKRTYRSKWHVSFKEYDKSYYPPYCLGYAIVYSSDVVARLYASAQQHKYFWIDDVHITGTLAQLNGIELTEFFNYLLTKSNCTQLLRAKDVYDNELQFLFTAHDIELMTLQKLWKLILVSLHITTPVTYSTTLITPARRFSIINSNKILTETTNFIRNGEIMLNKPQTIADPIFESQR